MTRLPVFRTVRPPGRQHEQHRKDGRDDGILISQGAGWVDLVAQGFSGENRDGISGKPNIPCYSVGFTIAESLEKNVAEYP